VPIASGFEAVQTPARVMLGKQYEPPRESPDLFRVTGPDDKTPGGRQGVTEGDE